jgi:hypothetical protein
LRGRDGHFPKLCPKLDFLDVGTEIEKRNVRVVPHGQFDTRMPKERLGVGGVDACTSEVGSERHAQAMEIDSAAQLVPKGDLGGL